MHQASIVQPGRARVQVPAIGVAVLLILGLGACGGGGSQASAPRPQQSTTEVLAPEDAGAGPARPGGGQGSTGAGDFVPPTTIAPPALAPDLLERLPDLDLEGLDAAFNPRTCEVEITMTSETVGFTVDSAIIPPHGDQPGYAALVAVAELLAGAEEVTLVGHSSSEGDASYNLDLSQRRAEAARAVLAPQMPGTQFDVQGVGSAELRQAEDGTEASRAPNRRVVISGEATSDELCPQGTADGASS